MASLTDLVKLIKEEASEISDRNEDTRTPLYELFKKALSQTMEEIKLGANSEDFPDLVVINMIIDSAKEEYTAQEIKAFVDTLTRKDGPPEVELEI